MSNVCKLFAKSKPEAIAPDDRPPPLSPRMAAARKNPPSVLWDYFDRTLKSDHARRLLVKALEHGN
jgi:hypothetical protein